MTRGSAEIFARRIGATFERFVLYDDFEILPHGSAIQGVAFGNEGDFRGLDVPIVELFDDRLCHHEVRGNGAM